jgi:outer membrane receptor protein involved in Fe transport
LLARAAALTLSALTLAVACPSFATPFTTAINIGAEPLPRALDDLARQTGVELLYDRSLAQPYRGAPIHARLTADAAVQHLLAGTNLTMRRASSGALIIEPSAPAPLARQDVTVPEILVIGRRTQNADIRRLETDIQPYRVTTVAQLVSSDRDNIDQYFDNRVTQNTEAEPPSLAGAGETNSEINLRGLGSDQTLVLVDGRRMPDIPAPALGFRQADLNAIPLYAIDRIETLTGTAGGIYGFGALGGVVNVVLARDHPGVELHATVGVSSRGDAERHALEGRVEFSPDHGATEVMVDASFSHSEPLLEGQRNFVLRDRQQVPPQLFLSPPHGDSVAVSAIGGETLVLKPQYGGASLGSSVTFLPAGFEGSPQELAAALTAHAGQLDLRPSSNLAASELTPDIKMGSLLANVRHSFGGEFEGFFDAVMLWNRGRIIDYATVADEGEGFLFPSSPEDPFTQPVYLGFPTPKRAQEQEVSFDSARYTAGLVSPLPFDWRATLEATVGGARYDFNSAFVDFQPILPGGPPFGPELNPFGSWSQFQTALQSYAFEIGSSFRIHNHYLEQSLRLAGPVFRAPGGPAILTLLVEHRRQNVPGYVMTSPRVFTGFASTSVPGRSVSVISAYAELRTRLFSQDVSAPLLRGLELQLAVRHDAQSSNFSSGDQTHATFAGTTFTVGAKTSPFRWLTLRGSYATGRTAPPLDDLVESEQSDNFDFTSDPKRGNTPISSFSNLHDVLLKYGGSPELTTIRASTTSFGAVLTPFGEHGPRLSIDYSHIRRTRDVQFFSFDEDLILAHEDYWPQRVTRAPLTAADRALGYTGGVIIGIDTSASNSAGRDVKAVDAHLDWSFPLSLGRLHLYGDATYRFRDVVTGLFTQVLALDGYFEEPLEWRANGGADWVVGSQTVSFNVQYFGGYSISSPAYGAAGEPFVEQYQGSNRVPAQAYLDLHFSKRFALPPTALARDVKLDVGVINVFDKAPPRITSYAYGAFGYSLYGDPRQRRFQISFGASF